MAWVRHSTWAIRLGDEQRRWAAASVAPPPIPAVPRMGCASASGAVGAARRLRHPVPLGWCSGRAVDRARFATSP